MTQCPHKLSLLLFELVPVLMSLRKEGCAAALPSHLLATICTPTFIFTACQSALTTVTPKMIVIYA